jgi:hypothetical protein
MSSASASAITVASWSSLPAWPFSARARATSSLKMTVRSPPQILRRGDRLVGGAKQAHGVAAVRGRGGHAEAELHAGRSRGEAAVGRAAQALGDDERAALVGLREQQRELLAADAGGHVDAPLPLQRVGRDGLERRVAGRMAVLLVHPPEPVDVADDHRYRAVGADGALELEFEHLLECAPVDQPGERVGAAGVGDASPERADAAALMHGYARQHEGADRS